MWQFIFWGSLALVLYAYLGYPLILYLLTRTRGRRADGQRQGPLPSVCLIVSAFNEEKILRTKLDNTLEQDYPRDRFRVIVASDGSDDDTVRIAREYAEHGVSLFHYDERRGKSAVLNDVVPQLEDEIIIFTDANSLFEPDAVRRIVPHFQDPRIGCVVGRLSYIDRHTTSVGKGEGAYWRYEGMLSRLESSLRSVLVANGSIFAIRRELFRDLYAEVANDFQMPNDIAGQGFGVIYEPEAIAYERSTIFWHEEFQRKVRIILRGLTGFTRLRRRFVGFRLWQFFTHKLLRWSIGPLLFLNLLANAMLADGSSLFTAALVAQVLFYLAAVNGWRMRRARRPHPVFYMPFYFTMVNLAAVIAMAKFIAGERQTVWEKAESARFAPVPSTPEAVAAIPSSRAESVVAREKVAKS